MADRPNQSIALQQLDRFVGTWTTSGVLTDQTTGATTQITGTDRYEWLEGGFFLVHSVDVRMGDTQKTAIEIIGFDPETKLYTMDSYDNEGGKGRLNASSDGRSWHFWSDSLQFKGTFNENDDEISGLWQTYAEGQWTHLMTIRLIRNN